MAPISVISLLNRSVADVLAAHPATARVFVTRRMGCVGCTFAPFETVAEVALAYGIEPEELASSLTSAAAGCPAAGAIQ